VATLLVLAFSFARAQEGADTGTAWPAEEPAVWTGEAERQPRDNPSQWPYPDERDRSDGDFAEDNAETDPWVSDLPDGDAPEEGRLETGDAVAEAFDPERLALLPVLRVGLVLDPGERGFSRRRAVSRRTRGGASPPRSPRRLPGSRTASDRSDPWRDRLCAAVGFCLCVGLSAVRLCRAADGAAQR
jgi:hypothetical protein